MRGPDEKVVKKPYGSSQLIVYGGIHEITRTSSMSGTKFDIFILFNKSK